MKVKVIRYETALALLQKVAAGKEEYIYEPPRPQSCYNWVRDEDDKRLPSCIVGHVFAELGVLDVVDATESFNSARGNIPNFRFTNAAAALLSTVQSRQDTGVPWGEAIILGRQRHAGHSFDNELFDGEEEWQLP